jgi:lysophospholipase
LEAAPELQLGGVTWGWVWFALQLARRLEATTARVSVPVSLITASEERLVDNRAARTFADRVPGARYLEIEGAYHEILMETDAVRARFWAEFDAVAATSPTA